MNFNPLIRGGFCCYYPAIFKYNNRVNKYWLTLKIAFQDLLEYRFDLFMRTFRYTASIILLVFLWLAVAKESTFTFLDPRKIVTYYLFSAIIYGLSNFHTLQVEEDIRLGYISKYLVKPISPYGTYFLSLFTQAAAEVVIKLALLIPIALFLGYHFAISPLELLLCVLMLFLIFFA
jgi:ABC-type uncharacterized transport system permease subunit